jgi:predicted nucleic acid-binding protein
VKLYLDASVVILHIQGSPRVQASINVRMQCATDAGGQIIASDLTRLECRVRPLRTGDVALMARYDQFFNSGEVTLVPISREAWDSAAEVRAKHRLKTPDALHVACAVTLGCDLLLTADGRLARCPEVRSELVSP